MKRTLLALVMLAACGGDDTSEQGDAEAAYLEAREQWVYHTSKKTECEADYAPTQGDVLSQMSDVFTYEVHCGHKLRGEQMEHCAAVCPDGSALTELRKSDGAYTSCGQTTAFQFVQGMCVYTHDPGPEPQPEDYGLDHDPFAGATTRVEGSWAE
jgi:hypothetical protein